MSLLYQSVGISLSLSLSLSIRVRHFRDRNYLIPHREFPLFEISTFLFDSELPSLITESHNEHPARTDRMCNFHGTREERVTRHVNRKWVVSRNFHGPPRAVDSRYDDDVCVEFFANSGKCTRLTGERLSRNMTTVEKTGG